MMEQRRRRGGCFKRRTPRARRLPGTRSGGSYSLLPKDGRVHIFCKDGMPDVPPFGAAISAAACAAARALNIVLCCCVRCCAPLAVSFARRARVCSCLTTRHVLCVVRERMECVHDGRREKGLRAASTDESIDTIQLNSVVVALSMTRRGCASRVALPRTLCPHGCISVSARAT